MVEDRLRSSVSAGDAEEEAHGDGDFWRRVLEAVRDGIWFIDEDDVIRFANPALGALVGRPHHRLTGKRLSDFPEALLGEFLAHYRAAKQNRLPARYEVRIDLPGRGPRIHEGWLLPYDADGRFRGMIGTSRDVTERAALEAQLRAEAEYRATLLRELEHRVKNSLNVISSILNIERDNLADERSRLIFEDAIARIRSIAGVYENLASSDDQSCVAFDLYLRDLADSLAASPGSSGGGWIRTELAPVRIESRRAIPLGLVVNELLTNALKYAYRGREPGPIFVSLAAIEDRLVIRVEDEGVGLPEDFDPETHRGLGMTLLRMLCAQVNAQLSIEGRNGVHARVELKL